MKKKQYYILIIVIILLLGLLPYSKSVNTESKKATILGGAFHFFVIKNNGELLAWGDNSFGILGREDIIYTKSSLEAAKIMDYVKTISTSQFISFAIDINDNLWVWGTNFRGVLDKYTTEHDVPYPIKLMDDVALISAGQHNLVIKQDRSLWGWGAYYYGQLGDGRYNKYLIDNTGEYYDTPSFDMQYEKEPIKIMDNVCFALADGNCSFAIKSDGSLWAWGYNKNGELGDGTTISQCYPIKIMDNIRFVSPGYYAIKNDGSLWAWGPEVDNENGNLEQKNLLPKKIMDDVIFASKFYGNQSVAIKKDGSFWTWGDNSFGQLGDGTTNSRTDPIKIMDDAIYAAGNSFSTLVLKKDGDLWQMGTYGDTGDSVYKPHKIMDDIMLPETISFEEKIQS